MLVCPTEAITRDALYHSDIRLRGTSLGIQSRVPQSRGPAGRIEEGVKGRGVIPSYREVLQEEKVTQRYVLDFSFDEGKEHEHIASGYHREILGLKAGMVDNKEIPNVVVNELGVTTNEATTAWIV
jgi:hypothetical protein